MTRFQTPDNVPASSNQEAFSKITADLASLFNYPALGQLFDNRDTRGLSEMRARLTRTTEQLERVIRQGSKEDATCATRAARAYSTTLAFLDELERLRESLAK